MPLVSVIIPTYNRVDVILRTIRSVKQQTFEDYEIIVVDDGSTDNTVEVIKDFDRQIRLIRQENQGVSVARNNGVKASKGKYIAFLDSDDEWYPLYLEACIAFLNNNLDEHVVHTEFEWHLRKNYVEIQPIIDIPRIWLPMARSIGSKMLELPPGESDHYLRIYKEKIPIGEWGRSFQEKMSKPITYYYRGNIFEYWRWGYLMTVWSTVITREAFERVGGFYQRYSSSEDYFFLARLCSYYTANLLPFPGAIKHEFKEDGTTLNEPHLASGKNIFNFATNYLKMFDSVFYNNNPSDNELKKIRAYNQTYISEVALMVHDRKSAIEYSRAALDLFPGYFRAKLILYISKIIPNAVLVKIVYCMLKKIRYYTRKKSTN